MALNGKTAQRRMKTLAAVMLAASVIAPSPASARSCHDANIVVINRTGAPIEVYDIDYFDDSQARWRSERIRDRVIGHGQSWVFERKLEGVGGEHTYMKVEYRKPRNGRFRGRFDAYSDPSTCYRGSTYRVVIR